MLVRKPRLLVLGANFCTLGLMVARLKPASGADSLICKPVTTTQTHRRFLPGSGEAGQRRFFSAALGFLRSALDPGSSPGPLKVSSSWAESWDETAELWRLALQALGGCVRAQPWILTLVREEGWLRRVAGLLAQCCSLPDPHTQAALEEALCAVAELCPACRLEMGRMMRSSEGALRCMKNLQQLVDVE